MNRIALALCAALIASPVGASEWMGSFNYGCRGCSAEWSSPLKQGKNVIQTNRGLLVATRTGNKVKFSGKGGSGKGAIHRGHFVGTFKTSGGSKVSVHGTKSGKGR